ncbi:hypothetical protein GUJ93_ZPchr0014g46673 [Zizania palustris]|uniref:Uncharacterized protein n=1 Tax=Zizania palustris TaxID=103762 RepID=A0A8J5SXG1_ZIZPA|nr:hypothetical protein GUJ93_ZPchr0014g46673 [Zizania palustris]
MPTRIRRARFPNTRRLVAAWRHSTPAGERIGGVGRLYRYHQISRPAGSHPSHDGARLAPSSSADARTAEVLHASPALRPELRYARRLFLHAASNYDHVIDRSPDAEAALPLSGWPPWRWRSLPVLLRRFEARVPKCAALPLLSKDPLRGSKPSLMLRFQPPSRRPPELRLKAFKCSYDALKRGFRSVQCSPSQAKTL